MGGKVSEEWVREVLREADVNNDNNLSKAELKKAFKRMGSKLPPFRTWSCLQEADGNRDGEMDLLLRYIMN